MSGGTLMVNALTVDLEDWPQAVLDHRLPVTDRVAGNTERVLALLDRHRVRATFFALGKVCERFPHLLPMVASAGHEIASHGYGHQLVCNLTPEEFEADVRRSIAIIEAQTGLRPAGYRAPAFSITRRSLWAYPILARLGFRYSSSVFPIRKRRYGIADAPRGPYPLEDGRIVEFPMATWRILGRNIPACGGGYMRLLPGPVHGAAVRQLNAAGHPAVAYLHPYELSVGEIDGFVRDGWEVSRWRRLTQSLWRERVEARLAYLLDRFEFTTLSGCRAAMRSPEGVVSTAESTGAQAAGPIACTNSTDRRAVLSLVRG